MDVLDRIRDVCYKRGIPISHLEKIRENKEADNLLKSL